MAWNPRHSRIRRSGQLPASGPSAIAPSAFVFSPSVEATTPFRPDNVTSFFIRVRNEVGATQVRLHDLRHFTATQLIGAGVDVRTVAGRLGRSDPSVTVRVYSHALEERDRAAAAITGRMLDPTVLRAVDVEAGPERQGETAESGHGADSTHG